MEPGLGICIWCLSNRAVEFAAERLEVTLILQSVSIKNSEAASFSESNSPHQSVSLEFQGGCVT